MPRRATLALKFAVCEKTLPVTIATGAVELTLPKLRYKVLALDRPVPGQAIFKSAADRVAGFCPRGGRSFRAARRAGECAFDVRVRIREFGDRHRGPVRSIETDPRRA